jgi:uncharacterized protein YdaU (DUF1376 family)
MALRDQPYLPLYIQDFLTDEKLINCSASSTGIYIRLMCIMHKSEDYGKILLKQKFKQTESMTLNFALQISKAMPYDVKEIHSGIEELIEEKVICIDGEWLLQKRMVKDFNISELRSKSGKIGGQKSLEKRNILDNFADDFAGSFAQAKVQANSEYENAYENENKEKENPLKNSNLFRQPKIPTKDQVWEVFSRAGGTKDMAKSFYEKYESTGWFINGSPVTNWTSLANRFITNWRNLDESRKTPRIQETDNTKVKIKLK